MMSRGIDLNELQEIATKREIQQIAAPLQKLRCG
jgi:hypothetical protein